MRNWIQTVHLASEGPKLQPFLHKWNLRRPIDMKLGPDGALYLVEYGDRWWENADSRIVRAFTAGGIVRRSHRSLRARRRAGSRSPSRSTRVARPIRTAMP